MLSVGNQIIIEDATVGPRELSAFFRGYRRPEQLLIFNPGMISYKIEGEEILSIGDLYDMRNVERGFNWKNLGAVLKNVSVEFSRLDNGDLYVHDVRVVA